LLIVLAGGAALWGLRRRAAVGHVTGAAWDCGFGAPPPWLPFGDPATQISGAGFAQPLRRILGTSLLAARETVDLPPPGDTAPARYAATQADPFATHLFARVAAWRDRLSGYADAMQFLTIRRTLMVMFAALVAFLAVIAALEQ
jgi:hypothetical protein